jgi:hypothetical protein
MSISSFSTHRRQRKEWNSKHAETRRDNFAHPRLGHRVTIPYSRHRDHTPPQGVRIADKVRRTIRSNHVLLGQVDKIWAENQPEESNVQCCYQFLGEITKERKLHLRSQTAQFWQNYIHVLKLHNFDKIDFRHLAMFFYFCLFSNENFLHSQTTEK